MTLSRSQKGGLLFLVIVGLFVVILITNPRWIIPNATISGAITGEYTEWTSHVKLDADVTVDGNKTLVLDGVIFHNPQSHHLIITDTATLIMMNTHIAEDDTGEIRVRSEDDSSVYILQSLIMYFTETNDRGNVTIDDSTINYLTCVGDLGDIRVKLVCSIVEVIGLEHGQIPIIVNSTILNGNYLGECDPAICCK